MATSDREMSREKQNTCRVWSFTLSVPKIHAETIVRPPPTKRTHQSTLGSRVLLCSILIKRLCFALAPRLGLSGATPDRSPCRHKSAPTSAAACAVAPAVLQQDDRYRPLRSPQNRHSGQLRQSWSRLCTA